MPHWLVEIPHDFWAVLGEMAPYLLFGFFAAGVLSVLIPPHLVERHLGGGGFGPVVKAAVLGVPMPLCSCGVILVTFSLLGPIFAIFRPIAALVGGLLGGGLVALDKKHGRPNAKDAPACTDACCDVPAGLKGSRLYRILAYGFDALPRDIGKALLVGLVLAALISAIIPENYFGPYLGGGIGAILIMMLVGIPVYVCATASVPVAAALVLQAGVSPGAALAFLLTGPATNAATIVTVWKVMGPRTALIYLGTVAATALASGLALDLIFQSQGVSPQPGMAWMLPGWVKAASAAVTPVKGVLLKSVKAKRRAAVELMHKTLAKVDPAAAIRCVQDAAPIPAPGRVTMAALRVPRGAVGAQDGELGLRTRYVNQH